MEQIDLNPPEKVKKEIKRSFRLRPVDTAGKLNKKYRYLKSKCIKFVAWILFLLGIIVLTSQILLLVTSVRFGTDDLAGTGFTYGIMEIMAAVFALMVADDSAYFWLHMTMGFSTVVAVGSFWFSAYLAFFQLKNLDALVSSPDTEVYVEGEVQVLISCTWIILISTWISFPLAIFLAICCGRPVCCGQRDMLPIKRRSSEEAQQKCSFHGKHIISNSVPQMLGFKRI